MTPDEPPRARRLPRVLGLFDVSVLASAAMGPAYSLASTMGLMVAAAGAYVMFSLLGLIAIMLCVAIAFSRLSRVAPNAGSSYSWIGAAFGPRAGGYAAWLLLLSNYFATMATALPAATYTLDLVAPPLAPSPMWDAIVGTIWIAISTALLFVGARPTAWASAAFLIAELAVIGASALAAFAHAPPPAAGAALATPVAPTGIVAAMVLGIWMIDGWEVSASASEEAAGAPETSGRGGILGLLVTSAFLIVAMLAYLHVGSLRGFADHQTDAMGYVAERLGGGAWTPAIDATVLVSTAATLWTTVLYLSRSVYAMGRDGVLPSAIGRLDARAVPRNALLVVFACVTIFTLATGIWPSAAAVLNLVVNGTAVFLGALFAGSALAAVKTLRAARGHSLVLDVAVPLGGAAALAAIVAIDVVTSDAATRAIELGGLALGLPFALWRARGGVRARTIRSVP